MSAPIWVKGSAGSPILIAWVCSTGDEVVVDRVLDVQPRAAHTRLAGGDEAGEGTAPGRLLHARVVECEHRRLAAKLGAE
jgi:hypothetical protein